MSLFKKKIGLGKTKLRLDGVEEDDEIVQGIFDAKDTVGGEFPEHINTITVHNESLVENPKEPHAYTRGICNSEDGKSEIHIYRGSIIETTRPYRNLRDEAHRTTLHEVQHANDQYGIHTTLDREMNLNEAEKRAEEFARMGRRR